MDHGSGVLVWVDGSQYEGYWKNDEANDEGTFYWPDGRKYKGEWKTWKQHSYSIIDIQNSKSRFCMVQMDCQIRQIKNSAEACFPARIPE